MYREDKNYKDSARIPLSELNEKSRTFVWDFPEPAADYPKSSFGYMPSEYARWSGSMPPLGERSLFPDISSAGKLPHDTASVPFRYGGVQQNNIQETDSIGMPPYNGDFSSGYSRYNETSPFYRYQSKPLSFDADSAEEVSFLSNIVKRRKNLTDYFGTTDTPVTLQEAFAGYPDFGYYYDTRCNTWKREVPPFYVTDRKHLAAESRGRKDLSAYARIFKNYLDHSGETDFVEVPIPYKTDGEVDFTEALLPDDTAARGAARNLWRLYMYRNAPEAHDALEYAESRGDATAWVSYPYLEKHGMQALSPYTWQKEIYYKVMQGENLNKLWSDLTGLKAWEWDMPSLYRNWVNPKQRKGESFSLKEKEKSQKNITFGEITDRINKQCLENEDNRVLMASLDSIKNAWFKQPTNTSCLKTCENIAKKMGQIGMGSRDKIVPFSYQREQTGTHYYYGDREEQYKKVINVVDRHLLNKKAIVMGLDYKFDGRNQDGTDHFVLLVGKGYDKEREQFYYLYADPGRTRLQGGVSLKENRIYLDDDRCILSGKKTGKIEPEWSKNYVLMHVRPNDGVQEETESVTNIYDVLSKQNHESKQPFSYKDGDTMFIHDYRPAGKLPE